VCQTIDVINIRREYVSRPLIYTLLVRDIKLFNSETVDEGLVSINNRVVAIDPNSFLVMRKNCAWAIGSFTHLYSSGFALCVSTASFFIGSFDTHNSWIL
jgi:hypothetical protein